MTVLYMFSHTKLPISPLNIYEKGRYEIAYVFADGIFKNIFLKGNFHTFIQTSVHFVPIFPIDNNS